MAKMPRMHEVKSPVAHNYSFCSRAHANLPRRSSLGQFWQLHRQRNLGDVGHLVSLPSWAVIRKLLNSNYEAVADAMDASSHNGASAQ